MKSELDRRLQRILATMLTPLLKKYGFREAGSIYSSARDRMLWLIDVQTSRWNDRSELQFTINGGVYIPGVVSRYANREEPSTARIEDCCISVRIGMLSDTRVDTWWTLVQANGTDSAIGSDLCESVQVRLLPFLTQFDSPEAAATFLSAPPDQTTQLISPQSEVIRRSYASIIYFELGDVIAARQAMQLALRDAAGTPLSTVVQRLAASLDLS